jgi:hypothetical protein
LPALARSGIVNREFPGGLVRSVSDDMRGERAMMEGTSQFAEISVDRATKQFVHDSDSIVLRLDETCTPQFLDRIGRLIEGEAGHGCDGIHFQRPATHGE